MLDVSQFLLVVQKNEHMFSILNEWFTLFLLAESLLLLLQAHLLERLED